MMNFRYWVSLLGVFCFLIACKSDQNSETATTVNEINIRLTKDPEVINPFFSPSAVGRQVYTYSYLSLADYHPQSLELYPILLENIPDSYLTDFGGERVVAYDLEIKKDATWSDGQPITNKDYVFTINTVIHPLANTNAWKPSFDFLKGVKLGEGNKKATIYFDKEYMLSKEVSTTFALLPQHIYDKNDYVLNLPTTTYPETYEPKDSLEGKIFENINTIPNSPLNIVQSGPYQLTAYENNQYIILDKIKNHWTKNYPDNPFLQSNLDKITFKIVPDEVTAVTMAKDGALDLMTFKNSQTFLDLKNDDQFNDQWTFHIPQLNKYFYIGINNQGKILHDSKVRRAIAHIVDVEDIIENLESGLAIRTVGDFHPSKSYYNDNLKPIDFNQDKATTLLDEAGWKLNTNTGIREKTINGKTEKLAFEILITGSPLSKNMALLMQEAAKEVGMEIKPVAKKFSLIRKENISNLNYDMTMLIAGQSVAPDDPHSKWHSDNAKPGTKNITGYVNLEIDKLIDELRTKTDAEARDPLYKEIQRIIYQDQPVVFLYSPLDKIMISDQFEATTTSKRPGYFANTFKVK